MNVGIRANTLKAAILDDAEDLSLHVRRHLTDLVEEDSSSAGLLKTAYALSSCSSEGPALMPEEFALKQRFGNGSTVDFNEGTFSTLAPCVDDISHHFLAHAAFAGDEHAAVGGRDE
jgi:hypothetical protein